MWISAVTHKSADHVARSAVSRFFRTTLLPDPPIRGDLACSSRLINAILEFGSVKDFFGCWDGAG
jgi:hypothetical protein